MEKQAAAKERIELSTFLQMFQVVITFEESRLLANSLRDLKTDAMTSSQNALVHGVWFLIFQTAIEKRAYGLLASTRPVSKLLQSPEVLKYVHTTSKVSTRVWGCICSSNHVIFMAKNKTLVARGDYWDIWIVVMEPGWPDSRHDIAFLPVSTLHYFYRCSLPQELTPLNICTTFVCLKPPDSYIIKVILLLLWVDFASLQVQTLRLSDLAEYSSLRKLWAPLVAVTLGPHGDLDSLKVGGVSLTLGAIRTRNGRLELCWMSTMNHVASIASMWCELHIINWFIVSPIYLIQLLKLISLNRYCPSAYAQKETWRDFKLLYR